MRVLIVDDEAVALKALELELSRAGYEVGTARDGVEALAKIETGDYRVVISDWMMPKMDGLELCRRVRKEAVPAYVYFILLTSREGRECIIEGLSAGADEFLNKPFDGAELTARLRAAERMLSLETRDVTIFALARLAESRDPETGAHLERVRTYARVLTERMARRRNSKGEITPEFSRLIYLTSPLHDVGKVGIPDRVLLKPGKLTAPEFEVMKTHTSIGARTLDAAIAQFPEARFLQMARDIALCHHERYDGSGYPQGLAGEAIPLSGRIVALADVYDALTSKRVYKDSFTHEAACEVIEPGRGTHFDPEVVDAFTEDVEEFVAVREQYGELEAVGA